MFSLANKNAFPPLTFKKRISIKSIKLDSNPDLVNVNRRGNFCYCFEVKPFKNTFVPFLMVSQHESGLQTPKHDLSDKILQ